MSAARSRTSRLLLVALPSLALALGAGGARAVTPQITAVDPYSWQSNGSSPAAVAILGGEEVKFAYPSGASKHYPVLNSGPAGAKPECSNLPTNSTTAGPGWSGSCRFSQPGTYVFECGVHGTLMTATVTVTNPGEPTATAGSASAVTEETATLNGTVDTGDHETSYHFRYGLNTNYESPPTPTEKLSAGTTPETVSAPLTGLSPGTTYHYQLVAENSAGTAHSGDRTFTTPGPPSATTSEASAVTETGATLKGTADPDGRPTEYFFEWGPTAAYGQLTGAVPIGESHGSHPASAVLTGLLPGTVYHYRIVAKNSSSETASGEDRTFTTASPVPVSPGPMPQPTPAPQPNPTPPLMAPPPGGQPLGSPFSMSSLKLLAPRHGATLRGSVQIGQAGAGGRVELDLLAKSSLVTGKKGSRAKTVRVGRLIRAGVPAGKLSLAVSLTAPGKRALARHHSLPITAKVIFTPVHGAPETATRSLTLHL